MAEQATESAPLGEAGTRRVNWMVAAAGIGLLAIAVIGVVLSVRYVDSERERALQEWQVRLGIVADSRTAAVQDWLEAHVAALRDLAENASLQLYMSELAQAEGRRENVADEAAQAGYLRNLLVATANRTGFTAPPPAGEVAANVNRAGQAGIALLEPGGRPLVATPGMPPLNKPMRAAMARALAGEAALIDLHAGPTGLPALGFALPVYGVQDEPGEDPGLGVVMGVRPAGADLFARLRQPGDTTTTSQTYLVREAGNTVEYLSPLADGSAPLKHRLAKDTANLAAAFALRVPGGFALRQDYGGTGVLVTSRPVAGTPWTLVRTVSQEEALGATDARLRTILLVLILSIVGVAIAMIAVWRHGTSLRAAEAAERHRIAAERMTNLSRFLRVVTDSQPTHIVAVDEAGQYHFSNGRAARAAGLAPEDMLGKTMASVIGPVRARALDRINRQVFATDQPAEQVHEFDDGDEVKVIRSSHVPLKADRDHPRGVLMVLDDLTELTRERRRNERMLRQLIDTLVSVVDRRDPFSAHHSTRVAEVATAIAREMGADDGVIRTVDIAASLMNLGKIFVPTDLLTKSGDLSDEERAILAGAYGVSADLVRGVAFEGPVEDAIRQINETWDGGGPLGLAGADILPAARILSVANTFVGMISPRAYREALTFEAVSANLLAAADSRFDRRPVSALINVLDNRGGRETWAHYRDAPAGD
ncbi:MAG: PAS domain-containing protein [Hyphomicrobiales bacterium]|nr:PAS domain-containing protein [Hyphomicrobiales bacterium]